jgi:hypothetical protein
MSSITDVININQKGRYSHSSNTGSNIKALSNDSVVLQEAINNCHSIQESKKKFKNKIRNEIFFKQDPQDYKTLDKLIRCEGFSHKMQNDHHFRLYILYHPLLDYHPEYNNITKYKQAHIEHITSKMKDNTSYKIVTENNEEEASYEEDDYSDDII